MREVMMLFAQCIKDGDFATFEEAVEAYRGAGLWDDFRSDSNERQVDHVYRQAGDYQVTLTVTDDGGLTASASIIVRIEEEVRVTLPPNAVIAGPQQGLAGETLTFGGGNSNDPDGEVVAYHWNFGDGADSNERRVEHVYQQAGECPASPG